MEFSKKITVIDIIIYFILTAALIVAMIIDDAIAKLCIDGMTCVATVYTVLRSGYTAKAGIENTKKISLGIKENIAAINDDSDDTSDDEDALG